MEIRWVRLTDPDVCPLLAGLADDYAGRYGWAISAEEMAAAHPEEFDPPGGAFVVLVDGDRTVAGGGLRSIDGDGACEVKRMWTAPDRRRQGLASAVLDELEGAAGRLGYRRVHIETGPAQPEALALYLSRGYRRVPAVETYEGAIAFDKDLHGP